MTRACGRASSAGSETSILDRGTVRRELMPCDPSISCAAYREQRQRVARDHQLLVGGHDIDGDLALRLREQWPACRIGGRVEHNAEPGKLLRDARADHRRVLADAG